MPIVFVLQIYDHNLFTSETNDAMRCDIVFRRVIEQLARCKCGQGMLEVHGDIFVQPIVDFVD